MESKHCERCGKEFFKGPTRSLRDFRERARFCSNSCKVYEQAGFYKHWQNRKRPDLVNTGSATTMFKPGHEPVPLEFHFRKHGMSGTIFYRRWQSMRQRCTNTNMRQFKDWGGRGIRVEWDTFDSFKVDMYDSFLAHVALHGERNTTLDRIDNDGNYSSANCRWATMQEQLWNQRRPSR